MSTKKRIGNIASHVVSAAVESEAKPPSSQVFESPLSPAAPQHGITPDERAVHRQRLLDEPRMSKDLATWATADLIHRALAMGASCCGPIRSAGEYRSLGARQISIDLGRSREHVSG
eukprot:COSAG06_NODE_26297_length_617_cov_8.023166_2_plen_116_part_01